MSDNKFTIVDLNQANDNAGYTDGDVDTNFSVQPTLNEIADARFSRRQTVLGSAKATAAAFLGTTMLAACDTDAFFDNGDDVTVSAGNDGAASAGQTVTLTGSVTAGTAAVGQWTQTSGPAVTLVGTGATVSFMVPGVATATPATFRFAAGGASDETVITLNPAVLGFAAVSHSLLDVVTVPAGYVVTVVNKLGDPITTGVAEFKNDGTDEKFDQRIGDHGDALHWYGLNAAGARDDNSSVRGLLVQNHENITNKYLHANGPTTVAGARPLAEVIKEIDAHGVSVLEYRDAGNRAWSFTLASTFNRRITPNTPVDFSGPVKGSDFLKTVFNTAGTKGRGTINNCANGHTGWGTNLTCEENWAGYFRRPSTDDAVRTVREGIALRRAGVTNTNGSYNWASASTTDPVITRWDATAKAATALEDFRNEPNTMGWVLEIDPYNPASTPRKRTALGRFGHEGAWLSNLVEGKKIAVYMGDDSRREYLYKFVSTATWSAADGASTDRLAVGDKYLDNGVLHVAKFNADGTGAWIPLVMGIPNRKAVGVDAEYVFANQADILVNPRLAGDAVGATPMDRPEWTAVNPANGEMYLTLTNNTAEGRTLTGPLATDAANPRHYNDPKGAAAQYGNPNGHIIRLKEAGNEPAATAFTWDIYLFGADSTEADPANVNLSGLTTANDLSSPDGLWFSRPENPAGQGKPLMWIQTDDGAMTDRTNCMMLAALPGSVGDGGEKTITNKGVGGATATQTTRVGAAATAATLKRFLVGPKQAEITGVDSTPDGRTLFVGIQHPGENGDATTPGSNWPQSQTGNASGRPRSAVAVITRTDGGIVGL